ncbi:hypothetical protein B0J14DRAFT_636608 [Halenospora varia]|nr:hypothetical protein B0J14DRAFT_636608 [Halenospora varia]
MPRTAYDCVEEIQPPTVRASGLHWQHLRQAPSTSYEGFRLAIPRALSAPAGQRTSDWSRRGMSREEFMDDPQGPARLQSSPTVTRVTLGKPQSGHGWSKSRCIDSRPLTKGNERGQEAGKKNITAGINWRQRRLGLHKPAATSELEHLPAIEAAPWPNIERVQAGPSRLMDYGAVALCRFAELCSWCPGAAACVPESRSPWSPWSPWTRSRREGDTLNCAC